MSLTTLALQNAIIIALVQEGERLGVVSASLDEQAGNLFVTLTVSATHKANWPSEDALIKFVASVAERLSPQPRRNFWGRLVARFASWTSIYKPSGASRLPLYLHQWHCSRDASTFTPGARVEVFVDWQCEPAWHRDDLCQQEGAAGLLVRVSPDVVRGWCPGVVDKAEGNTVHVKLSRWPWFNGYRATKDILPIGYQSAQLRLI